jgi:hypothetical protein
MAGDLMRIPLDFIENVDLVRPTDKHLKNPVSNREYGI